MSTDTARTASDLSAFIGYFVRFVPGAGSPFIEVNTDPGTPSLGVLTRCYAVGSVLYGEYSDGPDIQHTAVGGDWALEDKITNDVDGRGVPVLAAEVVHGVATKAAVKGTLGLMQPFDSGSGEGGETLIPNIVHVYISLTGSDSNDGSLAKPFATLDHAFDVLGQAREAVLVEYLDAGTYPPSSKQLQNGAMASGSVDGGTGTFVFGPFVVVLPSLASSAPSDALGVFVPTGIPATVNTYRGLLYEITASSDPGLVGAFGRVFGNDAAGVLRINPPFTIIPTGTVFKLSAAGVVQPIDPGFGILPNGGSRLSIREAIALKYSDAEGMFVEIFGSGLGSTLEFNGEWRCSRTSGFCGLGVFNTDLEWNGAFYNGDDTGTSFCVMGGNSFDWNRQMAFSGSVVNDCLIVHSPGVMFHEFSSFMRVSGIVESATCHSANSTSEDAYPPFGEACWRMGIHTSYRWVSDVPGLDTISNLAGGSGVGLDLQTYAKACIEGPLVVTASAIGINVQRGQLTVRPDGSLTITAPIEVQVSGVAHPAVDVTTGVGIIDLSTLSSATPGE